MNGAAKESKVTRIAFSARLNVGKFTQLAEQARRLGRVRSAVWREFGSIAGVGVGDRVVPDRWIADGTAAGLGVPANAWKETVRDAVADITASREAAKTAVRRAINRRTAAQAERKRLFTALKSDTWLSDPWLSRLMRRHWKRGRNRTHNQIVVRSDQYRAFTLVDGGDAAAINNLLGIGDPDITLHTPHTRVRQILREREIAAVPTAVDLDSSTAPRCVCGERNIPLDDQNDQE